MAFFGKGRTLEASSFIFETQAALERRAIELGNKPDKMREVSDLFREQRDRKDIFDMSQYARGFSALLHKSWAQYCNGGVMMLFSYGVHSRKWLYKAD